MSRTTHASPPAVGLHVGPHTVRLAWHGHRADEGIMVARGQAERLRDFGPDRTRDRVCLAVIEQDTAETRRNCAAVAARAGLRVENYRLAADIAMGWASVLTEPAGGPLVVAVGDTMSWAARTWSGGHVLETLPVGTTMLEPAVSPAVVGASETLGREIHLLLQITAEEDGLPPPDGIVLAGLSSDQAEIHRAVREATGLPVRAIPPMVAPATAWGLAAAVIRVGSLSEPPQHAVDISTSRRCRPDNRESPRSAGIRVN